MISLLFLCNLVHQLIDLIQQVQSLARVLCLGNPGVDAAGDLVGVISNMVDLRAQGLDLLGGPGLDLRALQQSNNKQPLCDPTLFGFIGQQLVLLRG